MVRKLVWGWVVAASVAGIAIAQPPIPKASDPAPKKAKAEPPAATPDALRTADPLGALIAEGKASYAKVRDYSCTFTRQERANGLLPPEQVAEMKVRVQPASVYLRFARPEAVAGLEVCYVAGRPDGKLRWRPAGPKGANGFQTLSLDDSKVKADFRRPVAELGIGPIFELLANVAGREKVMSNPVEVYTSEYQFAGRNVTRYEIFTRRPHAHRYAYRMLVFVDKETKLPVRLEAYDTPKPGLASGELLEAYSYSDIKINVGLGDSAFSY
jgi:hypothetical protein